MRPRKFELSEEEVKAIQKAERETRDAYELRRLQGVRLYGSGVPTREITQLLQCDGRRLREWSQKYEEEGLKGLKSKWQGDNALKLSREQRAELKTRLHENRADEVIHPEVRISQGAFWTVSDLQIVVQMWYGVTYRSVSSYTGLMDECGFSYPKTEKSYRSRPSAEDVAKFEIELEKN